MHTQRCFVTPLQAERKTAWSEAILVTPGVTVETSHLGGLDEVI